MLIQCTECGGKVSDKASACPHCGAPVTVSEKKPEMKEPQKENTAPDPVIRGDKIVYPEEKRFAALPHRQARENQRNSCPLYITILHKVFFLASVLIVLFGLFFLLISWNPGNLREKLRESAEEEEPEEVSSARIFLKTQILSILNAVEGKDSRKTEPEKSVLPPVRKEELPEVVEKVPNAGIGETLPPPQGNP